MPKMSRMKMLKGHCSHCNGLLEFPAESTGLTMDCPLCGQPTELLLARPVEEPTIPRKTIVWTGIAVVVLAAGLIGAIAALKWAERWAGQKQGSTSMSQPTVQPKQPAGPAELAARSGLQVSTI